MTTNRLKSENKKINQIKFWKVAQIWSRISWSQRNRFHTWQWNRSSLAACFMPRSVKIHIYKTGLDPSSRHFCWFHCARVLFRISLSKVNAQHWPPRVLAPFHSSSFRRRSVSRTVLIMERPKCEFLLYSSFKSQIN